MTQSNLLKAKKINLLLNLVFEYIQLDDEAIADKGFIGQSSNEYEEIHMESVVTLKGKGLEDLTSRLIRKIESMIGLNDVNNFKENLKDFIIKNTPDSYHLKNSLSSKSTWKDMIMSLFHAKAMKRAESAASRCVELFSYAKQKANTHKKASNDEIWPLIETMNGNHLKHISDIMKLSHNGNLFKTRMLNIMKQGLDYNEDILSDEELLLNEFINILE